jgi:serine protease Do
MENKMKSLKPKNNLIAKMFIFSLAVSLSTFCLSVRADESAIVSLKQTGRAFASIAKEVSPAVVNIQSDQSFNGEAGDQDEDGAPGEDEIPPQFYDLFRNMDPRFQPPYRRQPIVRQGSGFIIRKDGYIVTNNHLVQNATKITVKLLDDKEFVAKVIGTDPQTDIAVLKIEAQNLPIVILGDSDATEVGEWVVAIGNPFGLSHSLSAGIISAKGRSNVRIADYENFLQTDAAINPGNSGGALVDLEGKVIGINTAIYSRSGGYMGIGFAIPINMAKTIIDQLIGKGAVVRGFMGVKIQELTQDLATSFGMKDRKGILIAQLEKDGPADKAGLKQGDVIVSLDGKPVNGLGEFRNTIASTKPGTMHLVGVLRDQKTLTLQVTIGTLEGEVAGKGGKAEDQQIINKFGISVQNLTADIAAKLGIKPGVGVVISKVKPGSIGELAGLARGTVILEVNRLKIANVTQFTAALAKADKNKSVLFLIQDQFGSRYIVMNVG